MTDIEIHNFLCNYFLPESEKSSFKIQKWLNSIANDLLAKECEAVLTHTPNYDESLIFIKDLKIDFSFNVDKSDDKAIANLWANKITSAIASTLASAAGEDTVIRFRSNSEYLATFIIDLLRGVAWQKWYYHGLKPLRKFDNRGLIKELFSQNKELVEDILLFLVEKNSFDEFSRALLEEDIKVIFTDYIDAHETQRSRSYKELVGILTKILDEYAIHLQGEQFLSFKNYLGLYLTALQKYPDLGSAASLKKAVKLTFMLREFFKKQKRAKVGMGPTAQGDLEELLSAVHEWESGEFSGLSALIREVTFSEGDGVLLDIIKGIKEKTLSADEIFTPYGGLFVLIRTILDTRLNMLIESSSFPESENLSKTKVFLLFLAQKLAGQKEVLYEDIDPGLLLFAGYKVPPMPGLLKSYILTITPEMNREFLKSLTDLSENIEMVLPEKAEDIGFDAVLDVTKNLIYASFAQGLRRFEHSNPEYISKNFLFRPSIILADKDFISVRLSKKPLDIVLRMSGLMEDIKGASWLDNRSIRFSNI